VLLADPDDSRSASIRTPEVLPYLDTGDANANMGGLNHADIVRPVPDCEQRRLCAPLHELDNERLLQRRDSAYRSVSQ
jgi:hypothetical protein